MCPRNIVGRNRRELKDFMLSEYVNIRLGKGVSWEERRQW